MAKALTYLRQRDFAKAVETLKGFEKKDSKMAATASTNLSFLYFLVSDRVTVCMYRRCMLWCILYTQEGDLKQAEKYADLAMSTDRYNPYGKNHCVQLYWIVGIDKENYGFWINIPKK